MNVLTIESEAFKEIVNKIDSLNNKLDILHKNNKDKLRDKWLSNEEVATVLKVSKRTLQTYRDTGVLAFAQFNNKIYYRAEDVQKHLENHYNPSLKK